MYSPYFIADLLGPYAGALLRFRVLFPSEYPFELPIIIFEQSVFHPLVIGGDLPRDDDVFTKTASEMIGHFNLESGFKTMATDVSSHTEKCRFNVVDILLYIRSCFDDHQVMDAFNTLHIVNMAAWQAWQNYNHHQKDETDEKGIWQVEMDNLLERSNHIKAEDMFEEVKHNNNSLDAQLGRAHSVEAD